jgi:hypothetical protein
MAQRTEVHRGRLGNQKQKNGRRQQTRQVDIKIREVHPHRAFGVFARRGDQPQSGTMGSSSSGSRAAAYAAGFAPNDNATFHGSGASVGV